MKQVGQTEEHINHAALIKRLLKRLESGGLALDADHPLQLFVDDVKGRFIDMIARHPGLADELTALGADPDQEPVAWGVRHGWWIAESTPENLNLRPITEDQFLQLSLPPAAQPEEGTPK